MSIKKILAWLLVLVVGYVVLYSYMNPDELVYRVDDNFLAESDVPKEPLVKTTNPFVYYVLEYQHYLVLIGILYVLLDKKGNQKLLANARKLSSKLKKYE